MLKAILSNPKRLFVILGLILGYGIYSGFTLPVSMYPATSKPSVNMWVPYGTYSADTFQKEFGNTIESRIKKVSNSEIKVDEVNAFYEEDSAYFEIDFEWNTPFDKAKKEIDIVAASMASILPKEISDRIGVWQRNQNSGFFAASLYSTDMNLRELYDIISPILTPELEKIADAENAQIWNPERYIISVRLIPEKIAQYGIFPQAVKNQIRNSLASFSGSQIKLGKGFQKFEIDAEVNQVEDLTKISLIHNNQILFLKDIAEIDYGRDLHRERSFKTNGLNSLILFAKPKSGANVKKMSEDILKVLKENKTILPNSLKIKLIVDPAETINKSIINLLKDVFIAAFMAVLVLYLFIGGIKNVGTAAIEIPLSMILSFIAMKYVGMNLNLISLGGLALAAGMNVDASVVILENIFKHRQLWTKQGRECETFSQRLDLVYNAVKEVSLPVLLSIATTLIVFIPMAFTSDLTNAILGDLARAVIFSHAISGIVALIVVPTVRVILLKNYNPSTTAILDKPFEKFQSIYEVILNKILDFKFSKTLFIILPFITLGILATTLLPKLPKEVIGKPGSDWVYMYINAYDTQSGRHMENIMQEVEDKALGMLNSMVDYTWFERHSRTGGQLMFKLFDRSNMIEAEKTLKDHFINTPTRSYYISTWNPAELPLPKENHFKVVVKGDKDDIFIVSSRLKAYLKEKNIYDRVSQQPDSSQNFSFVFTPFVERWKILRQNGINIGVSDIAEISKLTKSPVSLGSIKLNKTNTDIKLSLLDERYTDPEILKNYPLKIKDKIVPLSALGNFKSLKKPGRILVKDGQPQVSIIGTLDKDKFQWESTYLDLEKILKVDINSIIKDAQATIDIQYPQLELKNSLEQLYQSLLVSVLLIFFVLWLQFQSTKQVAVIMMTIPLGIIGVIIALFTFNSFLSLNSALGIILLNGITVNNSILLTEVTNDLRKKGLRGKDLILSATKKRLRPILITSLTTILGMFPVALGLGDGGKILQPLGIAVTCGLMLATSITIFIVPTLLYKREKNLNLTEHIGENEIQLPTHSDLTIEVV
ncbi:MAG: HAE1 family hydrophobic/amphiphilic exporter-1 [Bacteriovoracaceae bacterium]|jgi:HAE1 family hydrophobic/amphiphilic exporter-1